MFKLRQSSSIVGSGRIGRHLDSGRLLTHDKLAQHRLDGLGPRMPGGPAAKSRSSSASEGGNGARTSATWPMSPPATRVAANRQV
jgi:hypothetical protein